MDLKKNERFCWMTSPHTKRINQAFTEEPSVHRIAKYIQKFGIEKMKAKHVQ